MTSRSLLQCRILTRVPLKLCLLPLLSPLISILLTIMVAPCLFKIFNVRISKITLVVSKLDGSDGIASCLLPSPVNLSPHFGDMFQSPSIP